MNRPLPPPELMGAEGMLGEGLFLPSRDLAQWARATFIDDEAPIFNEDHKHLQFASIGFLWTNVGNSRAGMTVVGMAEPGQPRGSMGKWPKGRAEMQMRTWFGELPTFLITLHAQASADFSDAEFCALVEHELYHCGQEKDAFGAPKFNKQGEPVFAMRGHDISEFVGVVRRYGSEAAHVDALVQAAKDRPEIARARIARACGACLSLAA